MSATFLYIPAIGDRVYITDIHPADAFFNLASVIRGVGILAVIVPPRPLPCKEPSSELGWWGFDAELLQPLGEEFLDGDRVTFYAAKVRPARQIKLMEPSTRWHFLELEPL